MKTIIFIMASITLLTTNAFSMTTEEADQAYQKYCVGQADPPAGCAIVKKAREKMEQAECVNQYYISAKTADTETEFVLWFSDKLYNDRKIEAVRNTVAEIQTMNKSSDGSGKLREYENMWRKERLEKACPS